MTTQNVQTGSGIVRIAVASSTGERVDQHFSKSPYFDIYDLSENSWTFVERRENPEVSCGCHDEHGGAAFEAIIGYITDCRFVVAQRIGNGALSYLIDRGIRAAQIDDTVHNALNSLLMSGKHKKLLRRQEIK